VDSKVCTAAEAMAEVHDGDMIAAHYWGVAGSPGYLFRALLERDVRDLTVCMNNFLPVPQVLGEMGFSDPTVLLPQIKKIITTFMGPRAFGSMNADFLGTRVEDGTLEIESTTHGVMIERLHAGAMALGGYYSPIGVGTTVEKGKEKRIIDGVEYIFEGPLRPDVGLVKAARADTRGNLVYRGSARGANPIIAMASRYTVAEVFEVVELGELDPEMVVTPGVYIDRIVRIPDDDPFSLKQRPETIQAIIEYALTRLAEEEAAAEGALQGDRQGGGQ
jgi:3-oxoadipate CoA-transferase alpha subunit